MAIKPLVISEKITIRETESFNKYLQEVDKIDRLTVDEEYELSVRAFNGEDEARQELVKGNLRFVISVAKQYTNNGAKIEDLVNEGNCGLIEASNRFDPTQGFKFISYAVWWIRNYIMAYLTSSSRMIRIPSNQASNIKKLTEMVGVLEQELERKAEKHDIIELVGDNFTDKEIKFFINLESTNTLSLDKPFGEDSDGDLKDTLECDSFRPTDHYTNKADDKCNVDILLSILPKEIQRTVITRLFGLDGNEVMSMAQLGEDLGISRERVRQIKETSFIILKGKIEGDSLYYMFNK